MSISELTTRLGEIYEDPLANWHSLATNQLVQQVASLSGLTGLPAHIHEIILFTGIYFAVHILSHVLGPVIVPQYRKLSPAKQHGFDAHVVSHVNAILLCAISFPLFFSPHLTTSTSYTPYAGFVVSAAAGYFVWDLVITVVYYKYNGFGFLAHAVTALYVFLQSLRPFMLNSAAVFLWFEASTPFVNINWFGTHVPGLVGPAVRNLNSLALLVVFFLCRIVSGPWNGYRYFSEVIANPPPSVPTVVVFGVMSSYAVMIALNYFWFYKMLMILFKMISKHREDKAYDLTDRVAHEASSTTRRDNVRRRR